MVWVLLFTVIPLVFIVYYSFQTRDGQSVFANYARMLDPVLTMAFLRSLRLAVFCTVACFIIGYPAGYILASKEFNNKTFVLFLFLMPMWMNFLLRTYAWMTILADNGVINSFLMRFGFEPMRLIFTEEAVMLGMIYNFVPFMVLPIYTVLKRMDTRVLEAAKDLGANPLKVFMRVVFPLSLPGVVSGVTMVFMPAVSTFVISDLLGGKGADGVFLIGNAIDLEYTTNGNWELGSALSVILMVTVLITIWLFSLIDKSEEEV
jgi:spermidine/putrescine transport system permease protein